MDPRFPGNSQQGGFGTGGSGPGGFDSNNPPPIDPQSQATGNPESQPLVENGERIENILAGANCTHKILFFVCSVLLLCCAIVGLLTSLATFEIGELVDDIFLITFTVLLIFLNFPKATVDHAVKASKWTRKYFRFLSLMSGQSAFLMYLSVVSGLSLWPSDSSAWGAMSLEFFALTTSVVVLLISCITLFIAFTKSARLNEVRKKIPPQQMHYAQFFSNQTVMSPAGFRALCREVTNGRVVFSDGDIQLIFNALEMNAQGGLSYDEVDEWRNQGFVWL
uniref:EF-hand domain-containing protein n=1 Tax=Chromera velia CCMP2878 TaxID=1169474 RepID=A0A0G4H6Q5_9ALVE|mmetsp:Transcript_10907/g.21108  ORF Transcript_10907/g.21108 Transcript_10907/m.21108 type:complete len:279 (+) Transcript_10907:201-1037(+)|eukprot:Cvel_5776.t1-p1 / transcript=Cvel_5776.t1 / gene=Cvel_5776 / organism=Chromera_velia_CCMP2878 / gene_product=hypothetical protein / transcript_product=hypothetical protein / location=Cvel_scaffold274:77816-78649(+) / protein_length=278 / sequence_SO=supercontig / SO=protein_coding / is_pseudo=false